MLVYPTDKLEFSSEDQRAAHARRYRNFQSAQNVWRQLSVEDRYFVLGRVNYNADVDSAAHDDSLGSIKASGAQRDRIINAIRFAPRDQRFSARYKTAQSKRPRVVRVRAHEKELRAKGLRRPTAIRAREGAVVSATT